jgi:ferric-dicitrate binding protein FerR (iron transport regulator)
MSHESERIAARAAEYLVRSREETPAQCREREEWLAADPRHLQAYRHLQRLDERAAILLDDPELRALTERDIEALQRSRRSRRRWAWLAVILLLLLVGAYVTGAFSTV